MTISKEEFLLSPELADPQPMLIVLPSSRQSEDFIKSKLASTFGSPSSMSVQVAEKLRKNDYNQSIVVFVSQGVKGSDGYGVNVQDVRFKERSVAIYAKFKQPATGGFLGSPAVGMIVTNPYQFIILPRESMPGGFFHFELIVDGVIVHQTDQPIS